MDERFRGKGVWIGLGALAIIFLCLMLCGLGTMAMFATSRDPVYVQPPAGEGGVAPPPAQYSPGPWGMARHGGFGPFGIISFGLGMLFKLLFFGLFLFLLLGLVKRLFWGHRRGGLHHWGKPPQGKGWKDHPHAAWGPWAWRCWGEHWGPEAESTGEEGDPDTADPEFSAAE